MTDRVVDSPVLDLLEWIGPNAKPYSEVIEAWNQNAPPRRTEQL
jgi:D-3-phosphoglycerate dehydrogenase / 2-oxoglutarate reductase